MRLTLVLVLALALAGAARAGEVRVVSVPPVEDVSLPFWCDWGYEWPERCYRDDSARLDVGGVDDKVWRSALRFSLDAIPANAVLVTSELSLWYDRTCVAPRRRVRPCDGRGHAFVARPITSQHWFSEREVAFGPVAGGAELADGAPLGWLVWDLTDLVAAWRAGDQENDGVLLSLADDEEGYDVGGPAFPSSTFPDEALRPRLSVWYLLE
jgi:hypothetical protein